MKWSVNVARVAGTQVRIHLTFLLLLAWIAISYYNSGGMEAATQGVLFTLLLFLCVLLHEFGHVAAARHYGIRTPDITLLPIGGVARLERMPEKPGQEIVVALAGPAVNLVIAGALFLVLGRVTDLSEVGRLENPGIALMEKLMAVNVSLLLFNLIPAFPMDGGRVLRALLAIRLSRARATQVASAIGQGLAFVFGFIGLFYNPLLIFIALFIYLAASQEASVARMREVTAGLPVSVAMVTEFHSLPPEATLDVAIDVLLRTSQHEFPVVENTGRVIGVLTRESIFNALNRNEPHVPVNRVMVSGIPTVRATDSLDAAFTMMQESGCPALPVLDAAGSLVGLITPENVGEMLMVNSLRGRTATA